MPTLSPKVTPYYGGGQAVDPANVLKTTATTPPTTLTQDRLGTIQVNNATASAWLLVSKSGGVDTWLALGGGGAAFTAASLTASTGNITATLGNLVLSGTGSGLVTTPTVVAAGASPQTANGRVGSVTFSGVSIAAGATQSFTISNTAITGSSTILLIVMTGATSGSAPSIQSVANTAGQTVITVTNGTGATTTVANITFTYQVLN